MPELVGGVFVVVAFGLIVAIRRSRLTKLQGDAVLVVFLLAFLILLYLIPPGGP